VDFVITWGEMTGEGGGVNLGGFVVGSHRDVFCCSSNVPFQSAKSGRTENHTVESQQAGRQNHNLVGPVQIKFLFNRTNALYRDRV
jgi:hypothetical protein